MLHYWLRLCSPAAHSSPSNVVTDTVSHTGETNPTEHFRWEERETYENVTVQFICSRHNPWFSAFTATAQHHGSNWAHKHCFLKRASPLICHHPPRAHWLWEASGHKGEGGKWLRRERLRSKATVLPSVKFLTSTCPRVAGSTVLRNL